MMEFGFSKIGDGYVLAFSDAPGTIYSPRLSWDDLQALHDGLRVFLEQADPARPPEVGGGP